MIALVVIGTIITFVGVMVLVFRNLIAEKLPDEPVRGGVRFPRARSAGSGALLGSMISVEGVALLVLAIARSR